MKQSDAIDPERIIFFMKSLFKSNKKFKTVDDLGCCLLRTLYNMLFSITGSYFGNDLYMNDQMRLTAKPKQCQVLISGFSGKCTENREAYAMFSKGGFSKSPP